MKKVFVAAVAALGFMSASIALAADKPVSAKATLSDRTSMKMHIVDITINNRSDNFITYSNPPNMPTALESGASGRLYADSYGNVHVQIVNNYNGAIVLNQLVCNRAVITVKGSMNNLYVPPIDGSQCF